MLVDLHLHSTYSDGRYTPTELVQVAVYRNIRVIALTDHDSWNGYKEAALEADRLNRRYAELIDAYNSWEIALSVIKTELAGKVKLAEAKSLTNTAFDVFTDNYSVIFAYSGIDNTTPLIKVLVGAEIGTQYEERAVHVLGYHIDRSYKALANKIAEMRHKREHRLQAILEKCHEQGMDITIEACDPDARAVGRPHVAKAMVAKGYVKTVQEAFDKYLHRGGSCYVAQPKLAPEEAVDLIHKAGGLAFLAHPSEIEHEDVPEYLLQTIPFDGVEIWHPSTRINSDINKWLELAKKYNLLVCGGSDFHGIPDRYPAQLGVWQVDFDNVATLINYKK